MERKKIIAIDLDDVVFDDFVSKLLILYNKKYNDNLQLKDITDYKISKFLKPECKNIFGEFVNDEFIENLVIPQDTIDALIYLNENYIIKFVTAGHSYTMRARYNVLKKQLPFFNSSYLIMCDNKDLINYDIIIDDCLDNLKKRNVIKYCVKRAWNEGLNPNIIKYMNLHYIDKFSDIV